VIVNAGEVRRPDAVARLDGHQPLRGLWREYEGVRLMPTFHPAYLLRNPADKKLVWADLKQVMKLFGKEPPARAEG